MNLFGGKKQAAPQVTPPATLPDERDPAIMAAARRQRTKTLGRGGRASTILTDDAPVRDEYAATKLGSRG